ncbi:hypothetical protein [Haloarchaeobius sp. HRN-SO-5]|uniref:hypothetical protein n=1 Tax=Haloarchaeobius sp. HRN-SO-5 TaxID=3446118 RepID=UPI003EB8B58F
MSVSGVTGRQVRLRRVESVASDATLRHVDQLTDAAYDQVIRLVDDDVAATALPLAPESDLEDGEIIVYTDYFRVVVR